MKKFRLLFSILLVLLLTFAPPAPAAAQTGTVVKVSPSLITLESGETASVEILIDDVSDLWAFSVTIAFDPDDLEASNLAAGGFLSTEPGRYLVAQNEIDNVNGQLVFDITQVRNSDDDPLPREGSGILIKFDIKLLAAVSETDLLIDSILLSDRNGIEIPCFLEHSIVKTPGYLVYLPLVLQ